MNKILLTGGTGSFGKAFLNTIIKKYPKLTRIVIFSRDELKQYELRQMYPSGKFPQLRFFLGDCWLIMYTNNVHGAPTKPIVALLLVSL